MSEYVRVITRPDPRVIESWCGEGVAHDHNACGSLWDSSDPHDAAEAARWEQSQASPPKTRAEIMSLVRQYALARIVQNISTPTRRGRESTAIVEAHARDVAEVQRLEGLIATALAAAGID